MENVPFKSEMVGSSPSCLDVEGVVLISKGKVYGYGLNKHAGSGASQFDFLGKLNFNKNKSDLAVDNLLENVVADDFNPRNQPLIIDFPETRQKQYSEVEVFFTKDKKFLKEYYNLRHETYCNENGWQNYDGSESQHDTNGRVIVAIEDNEVIGGIRVMFSNKCQYLSNEIPGTQFEYKKLIAKYDCRNDLIIGEISALVVKSGKRDTKIATLMMDMAFKESVLQGCQYVCAVAVAAVCRSDRKTLRKLG